MKSSIKNILYILVLLVSIKHYGQHHSKINVEVNAESKTLNIQQEIIFFNQSDDTLTSIVLNDWNHAYSSKSTTLAKRFSDEFYRGFHLAKDEERGNTQILTIGGPEKLGLSWDRPENSDFIKIQLPKKLLPNQKIAITLAYSAKIPSDKFTKYGYSDKGGMNLKYWYLTPARYENHAFVQYNNSNLDDIANAISDFDVEIKVPTKLQLFSDLNTVEPTQDEAFSVYKLNGTNRNDFNVFLEPKSTFHAFRSNQLEVVTNLKDDKINTIQKALVIDRVVSFVNEHVGQYPHQKIIVAQMDYERNPFYGLNQLPSFLSPFSNEFIYEIKFLKTYLNNYLKNSLRLDPRKDNWIYDGIQVYAMMKYIDENHPKTKMLGSLSTYLLLRSYNLANINFNEQYSYFYMLMVRKNLDQPLGDPKNTLIKFNEQIASKYRAGLSLRYLDNYLENDIVNTSINQFYTLNKTKQVTRDDFETILKSNSAKDINWFFNTIIDSREIIDYKFSAVSKTKDQIFFSVKNKTNATVPIPVYGIKKGEVVFKKWIAAPSPDSIYKWDRQNVDKIVLNYKNEVPEYNLRNNWRSLKFFPNNRPIKFNFMKDLEDPYYNQIMYVPTLTYNIYDGLSPGMRLHNKTLLDKPFTFDINPSYSTAAKTLSGHASFAANQNNRDSDLFNIRYAVSGSYFHYAPDATYLKINPTVIFKIREPHFRENRIQQFLVRQVMVNREKSEFITDNADENYSVFNVKYFNSRTEVTNHINFLTDVQLGGEFGKVSGEIGYRKLFNDNHQINLRLYAGTFLYNKTQSDFFSFALDRPTDYLFDYNFYGRSESTGLFSQQFILADGGFKSKLNTSFASQWIATVNGSFNVWNWIEVYGDAGFIKSRHQSEKFVYDSGIRLNLVTNYFELFFPVYSNNGWEIAQNNYGDKIRFVVTIDPKTLINLFTRKWF